MGIRKIRAAVLLSLIHGATGIALAQNPGFGDAAEVFGEGFESDEDYPRFRVEVLAFAHNAFDPDEELFPDEFFPILLDTRPPEFLVSMPHEMAGTTTPESQIPESEPGGTSLGMAANPEYPQDMGPPEEYKLQPTFGELLIASLLALEDPPEELDTELPAPYPLGPDFVGPPEPFDPDTIDPDELAGSDALEPPDPLADGSAIDGAAAVADRPGDPSASAESVEASAQPPAERDEVRPPPAFRFLRADELELQSALRSLARVGAYTPLAHGGWVQMAYPPERAMPMDLSRLGAVNPVGTVQLHLSRFLHVTVDLVYRAPPSPWPVQATTGSDVLGELKLPKRYALRTQRRVRSGEIHYFDHPAIGLLVVITPQPAEAEDAGDPLSPPLEPAA